MKRYLSLVFAISAAAGLFFLRYAPEATFVEGMVGQPVDFNPAIGQRNEIDEIIERFLFRGLFEYDSSGRLVGDLATDYEIKGGGKVYAVTISDSAYWRDGQPVTAEDVRFTFTQDPTFADAVIEVDSEKVIRFTLKNPLGSFLSLLTRPIAPSHATNAEVPFLVVGSGDFAVERVRKNGEISEVVLENLKGGEIKHLVFKFFKTGADLQAAAKRGEIDAFADDSFAHPSFTKYDGPLQGRYFGVFFNLASKNKIVRNSAFREAASRKVPISVLINEILGGSGSRVRGPLSGTWAQGKLEFPTFSASLKGGFKGKVRLTVPNTGKLPEVAEVVSQYWHDLGVEVVVDLISPAEIEEVVRDKTFEAIILGQEVDRDPDRYGVWHSTQKDYPGLNISSYADPRSDKALELGRTTTKKADRKKHYLNFQRLFLGDNPAIFLYHPNLSYYVSRRFSGVDLSNIFVPHERLWNVQEWEVLQ